VLENNEHNVVIYIGLCLSFIWLLCALQYCCLNSLSLEQNLSPSFLHSLPSSHNSHTFHPSSSSLIILQKPPSYCFLHYCHAPFILIIHLHKNTKQRLKKIPIQIPHSRLHHFNITPFPCPRIQNRIHYPSPHLQSSPSHHKPTPPTRSPTNRNPIPVPSTQVSFSPISHIQS